jgi:hypothetical protein
MQAPWAMMRPLSQVTTMTRRPEVVESVTRRHVGAPARAWWAALVALVVAGCGDEASQRFQIFNLPIDVAGIEVKIVGATSDCSAAAVAVVTVAVSNGIADVRVSVEPGDYRLCVTPLDATGAPASSCPTFDDTFTARSDSGSFVLAAECGPAGSG